MARIALNNGFNVVDCDELGEDQACRIEEEILNNARWVDLVLDIVRELQAHEPTTLEFVGSFCEEYTRKTGEIYSLP